MKAKERLKGLVVRLCKAFRRRHKKYYYATCKVSIDGRIRYMRWLAVSETGKFPMNSVIATFMLKYKVTPVILNVVEITEEDYENLVINIRDLDGVDSYGKK